MGEFFVWTYIDSAKRAVSYVDGYPVFPPEAKHPLIEDIDIGSFSQTPQAISS